LHIGHGSVPQSRLKETVEEAARRMRYGYLEQVRKENGLSYITTAHHMGDQAETVLMNLLRGSGTRGLKGMEEKRGNIIRPMLSASKEDILAWAKEKGLSHVEDETNRDDTFRRNSIRNQLIPLLQREYNPAIIKALCNTAKAAGEDERFLSSLAAQAYENALRYGFGQTCVVLSSDLPTEPAVLKRLVRLCLERLGCYDLDSAMLMNILDALAENRRTDVGHGIFVDHKQSVQFYRPAEPVTESAAFQNGSAALSTMGLSVVWPDAPLGAVLRTRKQGDVLPGGKPLSEWMKQKGVPRCIRDLLGIVAVGDEVIALQHYDLYKTDMPAPRFTGGVEKF